MAAASASKTSKHCATSSSGSKKKAPTPGITIGKNGQAETVWRREGAVFYAEPGKPEIEIGKGRNCSINGQGEPIITWQDGTALKLRTLQSKKAVNIGEGRYLKAAEVGGSIVCAWENNQEIHFKRIQ